MTYSTLELYSRGIYNIFSGSRAITEKVSFGIFIQQFSLTHLNHYIDCTYACTVILAVLVQSDGPGADIVPPTN